MKKSLTLIIALLIIVFSYAATTEVALDSANAAYKKGNYEKALKIYETILAEGNESANLYYNLGNTYFRLKDIPNATINYERAKLLAPDDEDINFNLNLVNSFGVDKVNAVPEFFVYTWIKNVIHSFSVNQWSVFGLSFFILSLLFMLSFLFSGTAGWRKFFFWFGSFFLLISIFTTVFAFQSRSEIVNNHSAIITASVTTAKSSPDDASTDLFIIHVGTKVLINEELDDWTEIKLSDGSIGWIKSKDFEKI
jgi:tetratricopeptide (TPR) repeat protein